MTQLERADGAPAWRRWLGWAGGALLGAVLLVAAVAKAVDPAAFARQVATEGLAGPALAPLVAFIALALEAGLGLALLLGVRRRPVLWAAAALVAFFLFLTGRSYWRWTQGIEVAEACGCFGSLVERTPAEAFWQDALLMVPGLLLAFLARPRGERLPARRLTVVAAGTALVLLLAALAPRLPLDPLVTGVGPGTAVEEVCAGAGDERLCLPDVAPQLLVDDHWLVLVSLDEPAGAWVEPLNELEWDPDAPSVLVLTDAAPERIRELQWTAGPAFTIQEGPGPLLRSMVRSLPRSLLVKQGRIVTTHNGLPPGTETAMAGEKR